MKTDREVKILLTKAQKDPYYVFANKDCADAAFCRCFLEQCNETIFDDPSIALELSFVARRLARETRDQHLYANALAMVASAYRLDSLYAKAREYIGLSKIVAGDCKCCLAEIYRREGIIYLHERRFADGCDLLTRSLACYQELEDLERAGRVLIHRGTGFWALGQIEEALRDEKKGLRLLTTDSPSRYYIAAMVNIACFLADPRAGVDEDVLLARYSEALDYLQLVREDLKGEKRRHERVRVILRWIEGLIYAKKGERRTAFRLLTSARNGVLRLNMKSEYLAISADLAKLYKTGTTRLNDDQVIEIATDCIDLMQPTQEELVVLHKLQTAPELPAIERLRAIADCRVPVMF